MREFLIQSFIFQEPATPGLNADWVLGDYKNAYKMISSKNNCVGVDYQPPTPAPAHNHGKYHTVGTYRTKKGQRAHSVFLSVNCFNALLS
jgi:hypothetical protein